MPSSSRRAVLALLAGLAGCSAREPPSGGTGTRTDQPTPTPAPTRSPSDAASSTATRTDDPPASTPSPRAVEAPRPSTGGAVDADWPSLASDAANSGRAPDTTGPVDDPRLQWVGEVPASGSPPVVADGTAVALGHEGTVAAVDATDGTVRWRVDLPEGPTTPVVADGTVYVLTYSLDDEPDALVALDLATGRRRWSTGAFSEAFGGLTVVGGTIYAAVDESILAVDAATGGRRWRTAFPDAGATRGPVTIVDTDAGTDTGPGEVVITPDAGGAVVALDAATGERRWTVDESTLRGTAVLASAAHGRLYVPTGRSHRDPYDAPTLVALDPATGERVGAYTTEGAGRPGVAATGDGLVVVDRLRHPRDRPPETPVHTREATPEGTPPTASELPPKPARAYGVPADLSGADWRVELPASSWTFAPPAVAAEHVYVGSRTGVATALEVNTGELAWVHEFDVELDLYGPAVVDGVCVFGSSAGLVALAAD